MEPPTKEVQPSSEDQRHKDTKKSHNHGIPWQVSGASFTSLDTLDALMDKPSGSEEQKELGQELQRVDSLEQLSESSVETSGDREGLVEQV